MVGNGKVVVNGLGNADKTLLPAMHGRIVGKHFHGIHGIISSYIKEAFDVMLFHSLKYFFVNLFITRKGRHFVTTGT